MCGIVGYIGDQKAHPILIEGLKRLEYRGYDSAGLAFLANEEFQVARAEGKLCQLIQKISDDSIEYAQSVGIGHTRWATHGKPSEKNAHPHYSQDFVLVHNGIIENHLEIKNRLVEKGHTFFSETDTEVICHLIQDYFNADNSPQESIRLALQELRGAYSLVILNRLSPDEIVVVKKGSPLVVGLKEGETFVASDIPALLPYTREMVFLEDGEWAVLKKTGCEFFDFSGAPIQKESKIIQWTLAQAEKGGYKHFMLKEIFEQPRALSESLMGRIFKESLKVQLDDVEGLLDEMLARPGFQLQVVACGTSYHAGLVGKYWIEELARVPVNVELASEYRYRKPLVSEDTLTLAISQSGETADTLAAVEMSAAEGAKVLSICNVIESSIPRKSHQTLYTHAGPEVGVASTKAFTTQLCVLYLLALKLAEKKQTLSAEELGRKVKSLLTLPALIEDFLKTQADNLKELTDGFYKHDHCYFLGRGIQYPVVLEGALKLKEISYIHAEGYAGGEMKHGPIALIEEGVPVIGVALDDVVHEKTVSNLIEVQARGAHVTALVTEGAPEVYTDTFQNKVVLPKTEKDLYPFLSVVPMQLLSYYVADRKGTDVDQPRNLAKSVTVE